MGEKAMNRKNKSVFVLAVVAVLLLGCIQSAPDDRGASPSEGGLLPITEEASSAKAYSMSEVSLHAASSDCWVVLSGKVYDLTALIAKNPDSNFTASCGKEFLPSFGGRNQMGPMDSNGFGGPDRDFGDRKPTGRDFNRLMDGNRFQPPMLEPFAQYYIGNLDQ
jgi:hypothetical protein